MHTGSARNVAGRRATAGGVSRDFTGTAERGLNGRLRGPERGGGRPDCRSSVTSCLARFQRSTEQLLWAAVGAVQADSSVGLTAVPWMRPGRFLAARERSNVAAYCASVSSIPAGQQPNGQVAGARDTVYGSEASRPLLSRSKGQNWCLANAADMQESLRSDLQCAGPHVQCRGVRRSRTRGRP